MFTLIKKFLIVILLLSGSLSVYADDVDIINDEPIIPKTNILLIMDVSGSMDWDTSGIDGSYPPDKDSSRIGALRKALATVLTDPDLVDINVGLSTFSGDLERDQTSQVAHGISYPISHIDADAEKVLDQNPLFNHPEDDSYLPAADGRSTRGYLQLLSETWTPYGGTPTVDAFFEATLYFRGEETDWGRHDPSKIRASHPSTYVGSLKSVVTSEQKNVCNRVECTDPSCDLSTMLCSTEDVTTPVSSCSECSGSCDIDSQGTVRETCEEGDTTCGNNQNCSFSVETVERHCITNSVTNCTTTGWFREGHTTWTNCHSVGEYKCKTIFGFEVCGTVYHQQCEEENIELTTCDVDTYQCTVTANNACTHELCEDTDVKRTELVGTAKFVSPIKEKCPANGIVLVSDGAPSVNLSSDLIEKMLGSYGNNCNTGDNKGRCGPELVKFLANEDQSATIDGKQRVKTFTIGLALGKNLEAMNYLKDLAEKGDGAFVNTSSPEGLAGAFKSAILGVSDKKARSFSSPSYSVDTSTRLSNGNIAFVPVFDRGVGGIWSGNLKKYELVDGDLYGIKDGAKVKATDASGALKEKVRDLWATDPSRHAVKSGGAANLIASPDARNIYTDAGATAYPATLSSYKLDAGNAGITKALLGDASMTSDYRKMILNFMRGENADGTTRHHMGDIIHSKPTMLTFASGSNKGVVFIGTNEGLLHGFDIHSGKELFAFMPKVLLNNIKGQYESDFGKHHTYGVDGKITLWIDETGKDAKKDGILDPTTEKAYLFFGLRRGGQSYYGLDVTNPSSPKLLWKKDNSDLKNLGFSWSKPKVAQFKYKEGGSVTKKPQPVLVFGGGYIDDNNGEVIDSGIGANVFIIHALTGERIFDIEADISKVVPNGDALKHAVPGDIRVIDFNRNGSIDRLYFADVGGNVWRVDLSADRFHPFDQEKAQLTKLAELGGKEENNRQFFSEPDVAVFKSKGQYVISLSIGTGSRPNPLSIKVDDHFFMLLDENVFNLPPSHYSPITLSNLEDAPTKTHLVGHVSKKGWKLNLGVASSVTGLSGEKVLSKALTFQNKVLFTSFGVDLISGTKVDEVSCVVQNKNRARMYALDLLTGRAALDLDGNSSINSKDSSIEIASGEIIETPKVIYGDFEASGGGVCTKDDCIRPFRIHAGRGASVADNHTKELNPIPADKNLPRIYWVDHER